MAGGGSKNLLLICARAISESGCAREALEDEDTYVQEAAIANLREAFKIEYDPVTKQTTITPEEKPVKSESLPVEDQRRIKWQCQVIYEKIEELNRVSSPFRDDKLYDALYEEQGFNRILVSHHIGTLLENGSISTPKPGYYAISATAHDNGTNTKHL